jgi:hypothetical protein
VAGAVAISALLCGVGVAIGLFLTTVDDPGGRVADAWKELQHQPQTETGEVSHLSSLGSNRSDFWRVALREFEHHPIAGIGSRGWAVAYLTEGRSEETPARAHSVEMDTLAETGIVGLLLLVAAVALLLVPAVRRARKSVFAAGLLGASAYWLAHTAVDWVWTIPAVGLPAFLLVGIAASGDAPRPLPAKVALPAAAVALVISLLAFAPPWLSARLTDLAYRQTAAGAADDLRWARRFDPLSTDPLVAEATLARPPANIPPLEKAVEREPRRAELRYLLGVAYLDAGRRVAARRELRESLRLYPRGQLARDALERAR